MTFLGKLGWLLSLVLGIILVGMGYLFIVKGDVDRYVDGRDTINLLPAERDQVLGEMRGMLEAVQLIVESAAAGDMATIESAATAVGMAATEGESPQLMAKLPIEFKMLGMSTHAAFDDIAATARDEGDVNAVLEQLGNVMLNCTSCHSGYRFASSEPGT